MLCPCPLYLKESAGSFFESIGSKAVLEAGRRKQKSCACASLSSTKYVTILSHIYIEKALAIVPHPGVIASTAVLLAKPSGFKKNSYTEIENKTRLLLVFATEYLGLQLKNLCPSTIQHASFLSFSELSGMPCMAVS
jgi:hypothetical protein